MRFALLFLALLVQCGCSYAEVTPQYDVLREFIQEQVETKKFKELANREFQAIPNGDSQQQLSAMIRNGTRVKLRLSATIGRLQQMHLDKPFETLIPTLISYQEHKRALYDELVMVAKTMAAGPKAGVDYGRIAASVPEITASLEYIDESMFKLTPLIGMMLISQRPDSQNHLSHLVISRQQASDILSGLQRDFGASMDAAEQDSATSSATVLRTYLRDKGFKFSDDPWQ